VVIADRQVMLSIYTVHESNSIGDSKEVKEADSGQENPQAILSITEEESWEEEKAQTGGTTDDIHAITSRWGRNDWSKEEEEVILQMIQRHTRSRRKE
jgi:hypothetical protein